MAAQIPGVWTLARPPGRAFPGNKLPPNSRFARVHAFVYPYYIMLEHYLEQLCDAFQDAICISDRTGIAVLINKRYTEICGIAKKDIIGKSVLDMKGQGFFDVILNPEVIRTGQVTTNVQHTAGGRKLILEGYPIIDEQGNVAYCLTFIRDVTTLSELRAQLTAQRELLETFQKLSSDASELPCYPRVVHSTAMRALYADMDAIAGTDATVLLLGETGVGKDILAHAIHNASSRAKRAFIKVDCGSIPENLIETELFGYEAGTFSGANKNGKAGLIEAAAGGTLFLDEIGDLPMLMQTRLLRVLQDGEIMRVGATCAKKMDVRFIAATNKELEREVARGNFRSDLYYRLKVAVLKIPALRRRKADILPLARGFLKYYGAKYHKSMRFSDAAEAALLAYAWPGNVRELENLVQGLVVTGKSELIDVSTLPLPLARAGNGKSPSPDISFKPDLIDPEGKTYKELMKELENNLLRTLLARFGTISEVARHLAVDRSTIFRKVKEMQKDEGL